jgi:hypothetical protein
MAISADQTAGKRRERRTKAATRKAMNMTSMGRHPEGRWWWWWLVGRRGRREIGFCGGANK